MTTRYLARIIAGDQPTLDEWNEHLVYFYRACDDVTPSWMSSLRTPNGATSYEVLAARARELAGSARSILDVGCGNGTLLAQFASLYGPQTSLAGIDLSDVQIARAQERVPGASLLRGDVREAPIGQEAYDLIAAHLSLMAMPQVGVVLQRLHAALRPSGVLVFVSEDPLGEDDITSLLRASIGLVRERLPHFSPTVPGREPIEQDAVLKELLEAAGFQSISIERVRVGGKRSAEQLWNFLQHTYPLGLLDAHVPRELWEELRAHTVATVRGTSEMTLSLRLVSAHA